MFLSSLCIVHCLALPFLILLFPLFESTLNHSLFHALGLVVLLLIALFALGKGFQQHRNKKVLLLAGIGISLQLVSLFLHNLNISHTYEFILNTLGSLHLLIAYGLNLKLLRHS